MSAYEIAQRVAAVLQAMGADTIEAIEADEDGDCYAIGIFGEEAVVCYVGIGPVTDLAIGRHAS